MKEVNYREELNPAQYEAVHATDGPFLVIAGAGSGKTRVLVYRVARLVDQGVRPDEILLLTFTRRAAQEMLRRAARLLDDRCYRVAGGTFHSFANLILRRYGKAIDIPPHFTILDQSDAGDTLNLIRTQMGLHKLAKRFPRKGALLEIISKSVNKSSKVAGVVDAEYPQFLEWVEVIENLRDAYGEYKRKKALLDYDDLLVFLKELLVSCSDIRQRLSQAYKYIMVDEYQDTNKLQAYIACLLSSAHKNIMVVGDDAQSIYSFRGADYRNIIEFPRLFPGARVITLEENYRSTQPILDLTNAVIRGSREKFEKNLFTRRQGNAVPVLTEVRDEHAQSRFVTEKILALREQGVELGDMAVLFRSGWHSNDLEVELAGRNIPFMKYGGTKFVEAAHIKDTLAYLRIVHNLHDEVSWLRVLLLLPGVGPKTAQGVIREVVGLRRGLEADGKCVHKAQDIRRLFALLKSVFDDPLPPAELIGVFLDYARVHLEDKYDDFNRRAHDLESLVRIAGRYRSLESFLSDMALEPPERSLVEAGRRDADDAALTLSTIHSAKGLEWHTVFLIYVADGHLPSYLSLENEDELEEERRLFYVASTRAKENLFLLKPHLDRSPRSFMDEGGSAFTRVCRFLDERNIMGSLLEVRTEPGGNEFADEVSMDNILKDDTPTDPRFLKMLKEYFRDEE